MKNRFLIKTGDLIARNKLQMAGAELLFCAMAIYISLPVVVKGFFLVLKLSKYSFITKENFFRIMKTPGAILYILVILLLVMLLMLLNITMMVVLLDHRCRAARKGLWGYLVQVSKHYVRFLFSSRVIRIIYMLPFSLAIYMPPFLMLLYNNAVVHHVVEVVIKDIGKRNFWLIIAGIYILSLCLLVWRFSYIRYLILGDVLPKSAARKSKVAFIPYMKKLLTQFFWNLAVVVVCALIYILFIFASTLVIKLTSSNNTMLLHFFEIYSSINIAVAFLSALICGVFNLSSIAVMSEGYIPNHFVKKLNRPTKKDALRGVVFAILSCVAIYICVDIIFNVRVSVRNPVAEVQITAHRGASSDAPENTIPAIELAIENGADFVEIDVRLTADGEVVLMHDATTTRTTDASMTVSESTYEELLTLDAGGWFSEEYAGTRIPTLEEVMDVCEGRIMMNIELKAVDTSGELEEKVAQIITERDMEDQCVVTSFKQNSLIAIKRYNPDILTGYIYNFGYSNTINYEAMDILSIDARYLSHSILTGAHEKGITVYVWTVNSEREMRRVLAIGADNIITDNIPLARRTMYKKSKHPMMDIWKYVISLYTK